MGLTRYNIDSTWEQVWEEVKRYYPNKTKDIDDLFSQLAPLYEDEFEITLVADTPSVERMIRQQYHEDIVDAFCGIFHEYVEVHITYLPSLETIPIKSGLEMAFKELTTLTEQSRKNEITGISTGFRELDKTLGGFRNGQLTVFSGKAHKTEFAINIALSAAKAGVHVYYFGMNKSALATAKQMICCEAGILPERIASGYMREVDWQFLADTTGLLTKLNIHLIDNPSISCEELETTIALTRGGSKNILVIVDEIESMKVGRGPCAKERERQIPEIIQGLRKAAIALDVPVFALANLTASSYYESRRPRMKDLEFEQPIRQFADVVMLLDACMGSFEVEMDNRPALDEAWLFIDKNRNRDRNRGWGGVRLGFNSGTATFSDYIHIDRWQRLQRVDEDEWEDISYKELKEMYEKQDRNNNKIDAV